MRTAWWWYCSRRWCLPRQVQKGREARLRDVGVMGAENPDDGVKYSRDLDGPKLALSTACIPLLGHWYSKHHIVSQASNLLQAFPCPVGSTKEAASSSSDPRTHKTWDARNELGSLLQSKLKGVTSRGSSHSVSIID